MSSGQSRVYFPQGATGIVIDGSGSITVNAGGSINAAAGAVTLPGALGQGHIALGAHLFGARQLASAETLTTGVTPIITASADAPQLGLTSSGDQSFYLSYASAVVAGIKLPPIAMPNDFSTAGGMTIELYGETVGTASAADAVQSFDIRCWSGIGDTEMGSTHPNFTTSPTWKGVTLASGDMTTGNLNITLVPGAHALRAIRLYDARASYTKKTS